MLAEAAIVNFYPKNTTMSGHLDDAELVMTEPIVSISLGCPAIFLFGGRTKETEPLRLLLESGDVVVMSGESRYCYHGIAMVLPHNDAQLFNDTVLLENQNDEFTNVINYLNEARININVRRVKPPDGIWTTKQGTGASMKLTPTIL